MIETVNTRSMQVYLLDSPDLGIGTASVSALLLEISHKPGKTKPLVNTPIYLADAKDGCYIGAGLTDYNGEFCFTHLMTGEYCLKVEYEGSVWCDEKATLKIDRDGLHFNVTTTLNRKKMKTTITGTRSAVFPNPLYQRISFGPNPSLDGKLNLLLKGSFKRLKLEITDLSGWIVRTMDLGEHKAGYTDTVDLGDLEKGTYILEISTNRDQLSKQLILQ